MKKIFFTCLCSCFCLVLTLPLGAQAQTQNSTKTEKYKVPKISTLLGSYKDSVKIPVAEILKIINQPLFFTDGSNMKYTLSSYQVLYKKNAVTEDEAGQVKPTTSISSARFKTSPLSAIWLKVINEQLSTAEEILFFDIIVKDEKGRVMYAPNLKFTAL